MSAAGGLEIRDLVVDVSTDRGWLEVLHGVSLDIAPGETLGLVGESGCGKSLTALATLRLLPHGSARIRSGTIRLGDIDITALDEKQMRRVRGASISMIFQEPMTSLDPGFTIGDQIGEMIRQHEGVRRDVARRRSIEMLDVVGIPDPHHRVDDYPHMFSGGMRQRAMIAMALSCNPRLLIADEPTTALDVTVQAQILDLLRDLQREHDMAMLLVSHDFGVIAENSNRVAVMYAGDVVELADRGRLLRQPEHPYTDALLRSIPGRVEGARLATIPGIVPSLWDLPPGCLFGPRCTHHDPSICDVVRPRLRYVDGEHGVRCERVGDVELQGLGS